MYCCTTPMSLVALRLSAQTFCQVMSGIKPGSIYNRLFTSNSLHLVFIIKWPEWANSGKTGWLCFESFNNCMEFCFFSSIFLGHVSTLEHYIYVYNTHLGIHRMINPHALPCLWFIQPYDFTGSLLNHVASRVC